MAAPVPRGMLRYRMAIQALVPARRASGQAGGDWQLVGHVHAHCDLPQVVEVSDAGGVATRREWRMLVSWHPKLDEKARLVWDDDGVERVFNIRSAFDRDGRRRDMEVLAVEVAP